MKTPLVSVIIPTFNRAHLLPQALDSVLAQTYKQWECLVVDDGSTDNSIPLLDQYKSKDSRIQYFKRHREPKGAPTCRNIGLEIAKGNYVIFLDSDDYLLPFCLEQRVNTINQFPDCDFLVFPMGVKKENTVKKQNIIKYYDYLIPFLEANLPWQTMCPIWKRKILLKLNGFTEGYLRFNDPELMVRALLLDQINFKVLQDLDFDTVHIPSPKDNYQFIDKVYQSLPLFIPNISKQLENKGVPYLKKHLVHYLRLWFKYMFVPSGKTNPIPSIQLILVFNKQGVITGMKSISLILRLLLYSGSKLILKTPINKLTDKYLY